MIKLVTTLDEDNFTIGFTSVTKALKYHLGIKYKDEKSRYLSNKLRRNENRYVYKGIQYIIGTLNDE